MQNYAKNQEKNPNKLLLRNTKLIDGQTGSSDFIG